MIWILEPPQQYVWGGWWHERLTFVSGVAERHAKRQWILGNISLLSAPVWGIFGSCRSRTYASSSGVLQAEYVERYQPRLQHSLCTLCSIYSIVGQSQPLNTLQYS